MSGHSKWSTIKRKKGAIDQARGKLFTKLGKEIAVAARIGGGNAEGNARLRHAVNAAKAEGMPKDNIERAIRRGTGELEGVTYEELVYEGYGPGGVAILVETTTDNKNRTVSDLRNLFKSGGGNLGETGSVMYLFSHHGLLTFDSQKWSEDQIMEVALNAGAEDVKGGGQSVDVLTAPNDLYKVKDAFEKQGMQVANSSYCYVPKSSIPVDKEIGEKLVSLLQEIEGHDDVQRVHSNFEMDEKLIDEILT